MTMFSIPLFSLGFRPFFLLAGLGALLPVAVWAWALAGGPLPAGTGDLRNWHAHELLFGYAVAVMAGFLLTAIRNWTGRETAHGGPLAALAALWLAGRIACLPGVPLPGTVVALVDALFLPALAWTAARPLLAAGNHRNLVFPGMLLLLASANVVVHLSWLGALPAMAGARALEAAALVAIVMITVMAGRVFPFFTERGVPGVFSATIRPRIEQLAVPSAMALALAVLLRDAAPVLLVVTGALVAVVHAVRLQGWLTPLARRVPLVWVLHAGYAWIAVAGAMFVLVGAGLLAFPFAMHALTAGTLGTITLGMMARVALGHSGRPLQPARLTVVAFGLVTLAAILRVVLAALWPAQYALLVQLAGVAWVAAFVLFVIVYAPILVAPRADLPPR